MTFHHRWKNYIIFFPNKLYGTQLLLLNAFCYLLYTILLLLRYSDNYLSTVLVNLLNIKFSYKYTKTI